jgi:hypothetical protein
MATQRGYQTKAGIIRDTLVYARAWPAAAPRAVAALLPLLSEGLTVQPRRDQATEVGSAYSRAPQTLALPVAGPLLLLGTYNYLEDVWSMALGHQAKRYGGTVFPQTIESGAYKHRFEVDHDLRGAGWKAGHGNFLANDNLLAGQQKLRRGTLVVDKQVSAWESLSVMLSSLVLESAHDAVSLLLDVVGSSLSRASATNPNLSALTDPGFVAIAPAQLSVRIKAYSASVALDSSHEITVSGLRLALDNLLGTSYGPQTSLAMAEPGRSGPPQISGALHLPRYTADTWETWATNQTALMLRLSWTGPTIPGTSTARSLTLWLPTITVESATETAGPGLSQVTIPFTATPPSAAAAGFPTDTLAGPLIVEVVSERSTHPLL